MNIKHVFVTIMAVLVTSGACATDNPNDYKTITSVSYVTTEVNKKQNNLTKPAELSSVPDVAVTYTDSVGATGGREIVGSTSDFENANVDTAALVTTGVIISELDGKQNNLSGTPNHVVVYANGGAPTDSKAVYAGTTYSTGENGTANNLAQANHVNDAVKEAFNAHMTCAACSVTANPVSSCPASSCTLWEVHNNLSGTYVTHSNLQS